MMSPTQLAALLFIPLLFLLAERHRRAISRNSLLLHSPPRLPVIGNLHQLGSRPHRSLYNLSKVYGPLMLLQLGCIPTLVVSSPEFAEEVMKTHDHIFASRPSLKIGKYLLYNNIDIAFAPYGESWKRMRKISMTYLLSPKMVRLFSFIRKQEVSLLLERVAHATSKANGVICLTEILNSFIVNMVCRVVLGSSISGERERLLSKLIDVNSTLLTAVFIEDYFPKLKWLDMLLGLEHKMRCHFKKWDALAEQFIEEHSSRPTLGNNKNYTDFIDVLLELQKDSSMEFVLTREHIKAFLLDVFSAGIDTIFAVLDWSMAELIRNPRVMKKVKDEVRGVVHDGEGMIREEHLGQMSYLKAVINEVFRLHPPAPLMLPRESLQECQIKGYNIPKQTRVIINAWAVGRDESYWEAIEEFKPERFLHGSTVNYTGKDFNFIPFGAGRRICPGIQFAIAIIELTLANLLNRFDWNLPSGISAEDMDMEDGVGLVALRRQKLELVPIDMKVN